MAKRSRYQEKVIKSYYDNREAIALQRVQEIVTELFLSEGKKRQRQWELIVGHLEKLDVPKSQIDHLVAKDDPTLVANLVQRLVEKS